MQSLFDEAGRLERMIYICYDRETYMNSGVKKGAAWKKSLFAGRHGGKIFLPSVDVDRNKGVVFDGRADVGQGIFQVV